MRIGRRYNLKFDPLSIQEIAVTPFDEVIGEAFSLLIEWGLDPDEELSNQGIII